MCREKEECRLITQESLHSTGELFWRPFTVLVIFLLFCFLRHNITFDGCCRCFVFGCLCLQSLRNSCWWPFLLSSFSVDSLFLHSALCACKMRMINKYPIMYWLWLWCRCIIVLCVPLVLATPLPPPPPLLTRGNRALTHIKQPLWCAQHDGEYSMLSCVLVVSICTIDACVLYTYLLLFSAKEKERTKNAAIQAAKKKKKRLFRFSTLRRDLTNIYFIVFAISLLGAPSLCLAGRRISVFRTDRANTKPNKNASYQSIRWPFVRCCCFSFFFFLHSMEHRKPLLTIYESHKYTR